MCVCHTTEDECSRGDQESRSIADMGIVRRQEHDVANHHERGSEDEDDESSIDLPRNEGDQQIQESSNDVRWDGVQLL